MLFEAEGGSPAPQRAGQPANYAHITATLGHSSSERKFVQMTATATHPGGAFTSRFSQELQEISS